MIDTDAGDLGTYVTDVRAVVSAGNYGPYEQDPQKSSDTTS